MIRLITEVKKEIIKHEICVGVLNSSFSLVCQNYLFSTTKLLSKTFKQDDIATGLMKLSSYETNITDDWRSREIEVYGKGLRNGLIHFTF